MKELINVAEITNYLFNKANANNIFDHLTGKAHVRLFGTRSDIAAQQQNYEFQKHFFVWDRPLSWKLPTKAAFASYPFQRWYNRRNEEIAIIELNAIIREYNKK